jgi:endoglucanase
MMAVSSWKGAACAPHGVTAGPAGGMALADEAKVAFGTNISGMEWAKPGLRYGLSTQPNLHFTVPRKADIAYLASCGSRKSRLPIQWELLQPMLPGTVANETARKLIGEPGTFHAAYEAYITGVLDAHAAVGMSCIIDNHNYCRYQDFRFQPDGSVKGLASGPNAFLRPYTSDNSQVQVRIFSLVPGATLTMAHFNDFWTRAAQKWKGHPGFAGYGLMNEPHDMPRRGETVASNENGGGDEDLTIWPTYAQSAIDAIRKIDPLTPIYVAGNQWSSSMAMGTKNPGFPLKGENLIYEVHLYLDAYSNGAAFDFEAEASKDYTAGRGSGGIKPSTGLDRLKAATQWAKAKNVRLALTEIGMPIDDPRWEAMFAATVRHAFESDCEVYTWMGGNHWPIRNYAINQVPGWHQNRTLEPLVSGTVKAAAGLPQAALFDDGAGYARAGEPVTITVYARGSLAKPVTLGVSANGKGAFSKTRLVLAAGANSHDSFTFTPQAAQAATLQYTLEGGAPTGLAPPPPRRVFSLADPVAHASGNLEEAALALIGKYGAAKWDMADGYTDYVQGAPAAAGQAVRAVADSGYGSSAGNAMEMLNFINKDSAAMGLMALPVMRQAGGRKSLDLGAPEMFGLWCKKSAPMPGIQPRPVNRVPFHIDEPHFVIAAVAIPNARATGVVFQTSKAESPYVAELSLVDGAPAANFLDNKGQKAQLVSSEKLSPNAPAVLAYTSAPGAQKLRLNGAEIASGAARFAPSPCNQMLIGWGYANYYPQASFGGRVHAVVAGKGAPTVAELAVIERYLAGLAGVKLG